MQAIRYEAQVSADHVLHIPTPDLPEGTLAEVIVLVRQRPSQSASPDWTQYFGKFARFDSVEAVNRYVAEGDLHG
ncbi:MAG: hypothetical protein WC091_04490 [Sulfuricellaceae bacterium]